MFETLNVIFVCNRVAHRGRDEVLQDRRHKDGGVDSLIFVVEKCKEGMDRAGTLFCKIDITLLHILTRQAGLEESALLGKDLLVKCHS